MFVLHHTYHFGIFAKCLQEQIHSYHNTVETNNLLFGNNCELKNSLTVAGKKEKKRKKKERNKIATIQ